MKTMKYLSMLLMMLTMSVCMLSCGDDDDEPAADEIHDFFWEMNIVDRGNLTASAAKTLEINLNAVCAQLEDELTGITRGDAVYLHDKLVEILRVEFSDKPISASYGTVSFVVSLKMDDGKVVKKNTLIINKDGCSVK